MTKDIFGTVDYSKIDFSKYKKENKQIEEILKEIMQTELWSDAMLKLESKNMYQTIIDCSDNEVKTDFMKCDNQGLTISQLYKAERILGRQIFIVKNGVLYISAIHICGKCRCFR